MTGNKRKNPRDLTRLSGKPLAETLEPSSVLASSTEEWVTSEDLAECGLPFKPEVIQDMTLFLLANPNMSSTHLYRADILFDSWGSLRTPQQKEQSFAQNGNSNLETTEEHVEPTAAREIPDFTLTRTVVRRLIPRNPNLDRVMDQTCHFYEHINESTDTSEGSINRYLAVYTPHITSKEDMPFYHPLLRSLAFLYDYNTTTNTSDPSPNPGTMSIHFLLFPNEPIQNRLERTLQALLTIQIRLARGTRLTGKPDNGGGGSQNPAKDNVIPQHLVQNTYTRLKAKYAAELCQKWVESTEPSKHVFEDLSITAFLIELWRSMYGAVPADEQASTTTTTTTSSSSSTFPGFVDVACGNGVLVYVLLMEGYKGFGFDARRRKTWSIFPESVQSRLTEEIYIPKPFSETNPSLLQELTIKSHTGSFPKDTFIISNHADELTVWTPLMATLLCPESPSPFIAIPCCSHSLSGARFRYPPPKAGKKSKSNEEDKGGEEEGNPSSGDLKSLRKEKQDAQTMEAGFLKSMYGSLTAKTMSVAEEIGYEVERTLLRIPSTRNMAVIGGRRRTTQVWKERASGSAAADGGDGDDDSNGEEVLERVMDAVRRECSREGGVEAAGKIWIERAKGLNKGSGMGKQGGH
ncbi:tRNA(Ser) Um(44) 2'-O-methyltransferase [Aspergillus tubingensis]|uniref:tRNA (uracil-O(2)-)-methyltransferase n=2 Tax=Aspergillus subgen. Circumdati TaxID=2720871 RepID=A0A117E355_ASPNG|nr:tRNA (uracil-O(2)-)-methyltransferase [Aspergillus niger]GLA73845.1 tRNA(Ser) Um(44) 2'-O-methyltransferase [Aspergillus tubingensis]GLA84960.1 tRNA(Ser) Um(44) 2'-O-methyltransferase [Aspergillus tubingensis]GLA93368.1 tRNA(Ser) Um(44) 2'-O-methyltransferase [Aspergillus tubingensis]GLB20621.1 tRNA(Ser) Um(44) 2'-O-methyltransferase [Aspergillus tubingensis]